MAEVMNDNLSVSKIAKALGFSDIQNDATAQLWADKKILHANGAGAIHPRIARRFQGFRFDFGCSCGRC
ncbi:hypothetical protein [Breoghania sp. L-A4]|uniref:hypothetical protein n=1 Tax=Breoghania sp. L-A4 TaxID=2304600 RepID=UPI0013C2C018|nr:hypothetical protein [Breoghania sp. L-A4]